MSEKLTPLANETAVELREREAIAECSDRWKHGIASLNGRVKQIRNEGIVSVFDGDAAHANAVNAKVAADTGKSAGLRVAQDLWLRKLIESEEGADPGSPVPADKMVLAPSDPEAYLAAKARIDADFALIAGMTYTAQDVPQA